MQINIFVEKFWFLLFLPFAIQAMAILIDEFCFHHKRGLGIWERLGHPLDTLTVIGLYIFCLLIPFSLSHLLIFICLATFSCLFVTKDEFVHSELCDPKEQWLHSILFLVHSLTAVALGFIWYLTSVITFVGPVDVKIFLMTQLTILIIFLIYQVVFWNFSLIWKRYGKNKLYK